MSCKITCIKAFLEGKVSLKESDEVFGLIT